MTQRILMIEDDQRLAAMVDTYLGQNGYAVTHAATGEAGVAALRDDADDRFAAVLLDLMLPDGDGLDICRRIRALPAPANAVPMIMLTAKGDPFDRVVGLEMGADDYLPKPFEPRELLARLRAVLRRPRLAGADAAVPLRFGRLDIDRDARAVSLDGRLCPLTAYQFDLLAALAERAGRVLSRDQLIDALKGETHEPFDRSIDVHIARLRAVLEDDPKHPRRIITVRGSGYVFARVQDAEPRDAKIGSWRSRIGQRLYVRIYVALLVSLIVASVLFGMARMRFDPVPGTLHSSIHAHVHMLVVLMAIALVVAAAAYPVVRRLTGRLERLQASVEAWGSGDLSTRVAVEGRDEVAQLAHSFNQSAARVEALVGAQKTLLANASHELRSPLARIGMAVELLHDTAPAAIRGELARNIAELDLLIDEVLLASRLDTVAAAERPVVAVDLTALVAEECARIGAELAAERVETRGDPALLRRMVRNLLENAQRHGGATPIAVTLTGAIQLEICDGGPGVPEAEREAIFAPFYRARGASEADGGHGLGLSLVRQIARRHGGDVACVERAAGGGCFRVNLPRD